jgi:chemotaxis signal transduction protein
MRSKVAAGISWESGKMVADSPYCLFHHKSEPYAIEVETVAEIIEVPALVRIGLCPPWIVGLCPFHREVVPVVTVETEIRRTELAISELPAGGGASREVVLIIQSSQGVWGIAVDRDGTVITSVRASRHEPRKKEGGVVTIGFIHHEDTTFALLDPEATWRGLRAAVIDWYSQIIEAGSRTMINPTAIA